jgi:AmmeMemoRadiSam system protein B
MMKMDEGMDARPSPIAGQWYPADAGMLASLVDAYVDDAQMPFIKGEVVAVVAPHAGYIYSGPVAGYAFAALKGLSPDIAVVISPMHQAYYAALLTTAHDAYRTPLGSIPVHQGALDALDTALNTELGFGITRLRQDGEHSLEIELPFLQRVLENEFQLLPVMVRDQSVRTALGLGKALAGLFIQGGELHELKSIMVASTDLSHFYSENEANQFDNQMLAAIESFDPDRVIRADENGEGFACGRGAVAAVLRAAKILGADRVQRLHYATSGDITGDYSSVVGYGAAAVTRQLN